MIQSKLASKCPLKRADSIPLESSQANETVQINGAIRNDPRFKSLPWTEKYRPQQISSFTHNKDLINLFNNSTASGNISHFLFYGPPGTGKTSAILAIAREIFCEFFHERCIEFNASDDRGINAVREKISNEARKSVSETVSVTGKRIPGYKIIILDEADSMTDEAQDALRVIIEQYSRVTRFCFICNFYCKITDAIKSRCSIVFFKQLSRECMLSRLTLIAERELMELKPNIIETIINVSNGDLRRAIIILQNLKNSYDFKKLYAKEFTDMSLRELEIVNLNPNRKFSTEISVNDVYMIAATITIDRARKIVTEVQKCKKMTELSKIARKTIASGYPVDNILMQLNEAILSDKSLNDYKKATILKYSGQIFMRMRECGIEYFQLLDYITCVNAVTNGWKHC